MARPLTARRPLLADAHLLQNEAPSAWLAPTHACLLCPPAASESSKVKARVSGGGEAGVGSVGTRAGGDAGAAAAPPLEAGAAAAGAGGAAEGLRSVALSWCGAS